MAETNREGINDCICEVGHWMNSKSTVHIIGISSLKLLVSVTADQKTSKNLALDGCDESTEFGSWVVKTPRKGRE